MTPRQQTVLDAIRDLTRGEVGPSLREVAARVGLGTTTVVFHVEALIANGSVYRTGDARRGLRAVGHFDARALANLSHHDLIAIRDAIDARLNHRLAA
jgi:DNA-binding IclR family transcriptional regulator